MAVHTSYTFEQVQVYRIPDGTGRPWPDMADNGQPWQAMAMANKYTRGLYQRLCGLQANMGIGHRSGGFPGDAPWPGAASR